MATPPKDDKSSSYFPPDSSNRSYFTHDAVRSGYRDPIDSRESEFQRFSSDLRDPVEREKEKDRIRAEIMAEQAERRRILEEEIRMELMLERQVALKRWELSRTRFDHDPVRMRSDAPPETRPFIHEPSIRFSDPSESRQFVDEHSITAPSASRQLVATHSRIMRADAPSSIHHFSHERSRLHSDAPSSIHQFAHERSQLHSDALSGTRPFVHEPPRIPQSSSYPEDRRVYLTMLPSHRVAGDRIMASSGYQHHPMLPTTSNLVLLDTKPVRSGSRGDGILGSFPYQNHQMPPATLSMARKERNLLENREEYISDLVRKRKASALDHLRASNLEKKSKVWRCALCKVVASSKRNLNDHLGGKKHKLMVEEKANPVTKEPTLNTDASRTETSRAPSTVVNEKQNTVTDGTLQTVESVLDKKRKSKMDEPSSSEAVMAEKKLNSVKDEGPHSKATMVDKMQRIDEPPPRSKGAMVDKKQMKGSGENGSVNNLKFWCGICQVGVTSQKTLFDHEKGRRHMENLQEKAKTKP